MYRKPNIHILTFSKPANYSWMCVFYSTNLIAFLFYAQGLAIGVSKHQVLMFLTDMEILLTLKISC